MFAPLNGAPLNGGATGLWARGTSTAEAAITVSAAVYSIRAITAPSRQANSESTAVGLRITAAPPMKPAASAISTATALRLLPALMAPAISGVSELSARFVRSAFLSGASDSSASCAFTSTRYGSFAGTAVGTAQSLGGNGRRTRAKARSAATAFADADGLRPIFDDSTLRAYAIASAEFGVTKTAASVANPQAISDTAAVRVVTPSASSVSAAESVLATTRLAGMNAVCSATAESMAGEPGHLTARLQYSGAVLEGQGEATPVAANRTAWGKLSTARTQSISWLGESSIRTLRVRQIPMAAAGVARSSTRAVPNATLGYSVVDAIAESYSPADRVSLVRGVSGISVAGVVAQTNPARITVIEGNPVGKALAYLSPTITRDGVAYSYADAAGGATAEQRCDALNITKVPASLAGIASASECLPFITHDMRGTTSSEPQTRLATRTNSWHFAKAKTTSRSESLAEPTHYRAVYGPGDLIAEAGVEMNPTHLKAVYGDAVLEGESHSVGFEPIHYRSVYADAFLEPDSSTQAEPIHYRWTPIEGQPAEAESDARGGAIRYRWVGMRSISVAVADPIAEAINLRWVGVESEEHSTAEATGESIRYRWVGMEGSASSTAESGSDNEVLYFAPASSTASGAESEAVPRKHHDTKGMTVGLASVGYASIGVHHQFPVRDEVATSVSDSVAHALRFVRVYQATAEAVSATGRTTFKINASAPAPDRRTIIVPFIDRSLSVAASNREYQVA